MKTNIISAIRQELKLQVDDKTKHSYQSFFKEPVTAYGVKTAIVNKIAKDRFKDVKPLGKQAIFALCEKLLESDYNEEAFIALQWAYWLHDEYDRVQIHGSDNVQGLESTSVFGPSPHGELWCALIRSSIQRAFAALC